jgi:hypothetical protein
MNQREKLLAGGLLTVLGLWQGSVQYKNFISTPVEERETDIAARQKRISDKEIEVAKGQAAARKYKDWKLRSLPPDPVNAISLYQNWLVDLGDKAKLSHVSVTPKTADNRSKGDVYAIVGADFKAEGKLSQIRDFLYEFRNSRLLHRVSQVTLTTKQAVSDPTIDLHLVVEGLSLKESTERSTLFSDPKLAELVKDPAAKSKESYDIITSKNLLVRGYKPPKSDRDPRPKTPVPDEDPRQFVRLTSTFSDGGDYVATLYDPTTNKYAKLYARGDFNIGGVEGKVVSVTIDFVVLEIKGEKFRLDIGGNLTELQKMPTAG